MKKGLTTVLFILDRSGSMKSIWGDASKSLEKFIEDQKKVPGELTFSLVLFDDQYEMRHDMVPLSEVRPLLEADGPRGWTALLHAGCEAIDHLGKRLAAMPEDERPEKVIVAFMTDGDENWSDKVTPRYTAQDLNERVVRQRQEFKWEFLFLGANIDAFSVAQQYGIPLAGSLNFMADSKGIDDGLRSVSCCVANSRTTGDEAFLNNQDERLLDVNSRPPVQTGAGWPKP